MTARRSSYRHNRWIQWWDPCVDPRRATYRDRPIAETRHESPPARWPQCLIEVLDEVRRYAVGRALVRHVRRRTTIYYQRGASNTGPDTYGLDDSGFGRPPSELIRDANRNGVEATILFDPTRPPAFNEHGLVKTRDITLAHELAHAVGVTHGLHPVSGDAAFRRAYDAPSQDEGHALILENMYRSESRSSMRHTYLGEEPRWSTAAPLHPMQRALEHLTVESYRYKVAALVSELEALPAEVVPYNPFRELARDRGVRAPRHSARARGPLSR